MFVSALFLSLVAVLGWALFMYVLKPIAGFSFVRTPLLTLSYFLALTLLIAYWYFPTAGVLFSGLTNYAVLFVLAVLLGLNPWLYRFGHHEHRVHVRTTPAHPDLELLALDGRFLLSKLGDVVFQQTVAGTLILILSPLSLSLQPFSLLFATLFLLGHLGLATRLPRHWMYYFLASAFAGGAFIPYLILIVPGGFYYAIALHMLWYVASGVFYWTVERRRAKRRKA